jgi:hypothetical protein
LDRILSRLNPVWGTQFDVTLPSPLKERKENFVRVTCEAHCNLLGLNTQIILSELNKLRCSLLEVPPCVQTFFSSLFSQVQKEDVQTAYLMWLKICDLSCFLCTQYLEISQIFMILKSGRRWMLVGRSPATLGGCCSPYLQTTSHPQVEGE